MYGYCPICGAKGIGRERRLDGNDVCESGHQYPSKTSLNSQPKDWCDCEVWKKGGHLGFDIADWKFCSFCGKALKK